MKSDILVVDNASIDKTVSTIEDNFKEVRIIKNINNLGFGRALNLGLSYGMEKGYDYILILNQDAELEANTLLQIAKFALLLQPTDWAVISPWNKDSHGNTEYYFEDNLSKRSGGYLKMDISEFEVIPVDFINAACWFINVNGLSKLKGFDERFFMYGEDLDFCNRAKYFGYKIFVLKNVHCIHNKIKGDYENNPAKMFQLRVASELARYVNPNISLRAKFWHFIKVNIVSLKLTLSGKKSAATEKFMVNILAVKRAFS